VSFVSDEVARLSYVIREVKNGSNRFNLDVPYMEAMLILLKAYQELGQIQDEERLGTALEYLKTTSISGLLVEAK